MCVVGDVALCFHIVEDNELAAAVRFRKRDGIVAGWILRDRGEYGAFGEGEV